MHLLFFVTLSTARAGIVDWCRKCLADAPASLEHLATETLLLNLRAGRTSGDEFDELRRRREWGGLNARDLAEFAEFEYRQLPLSDQIQKRRPNVIPFLSPSLRRIRAPVLDHDL